MHDPRDDAHPLETGVGHRVEIDPPLVGPVDVGAPDIPGMELHGRHLHRPDHRRELGDAQLVGSAVPAREVQPHGLQPRRRPVRDPLLVDLLTGQPLGEPVQHARPFAQRPDDAVTDREVVGRQVELGPPVLREVDPVGVAHPHRALADGEFDGGSRCLRGHHRTLAGMPPPGIPTRSRDRRGVGCHAGCWAVPDEGGRWVPNGPKRGRRAHARRRFVTIAGLTTPGTQTRAAASRGSGSRSWVCVGVCEDCTT